MFQELRLNTLVKMTLVASLTFGLSGIVNASSVQERLKQFEQQDQQNPPRGDGVVFLGSSTMDNWETGKYFENRTIIKRSVPNTNLATINKNIDALAVKYFPNLIVVSSDNPGITEKAYDEKLVDEIKAMNKDLATKLPKAQIMILSVTPTPKDGKAVANIQKLNGALKKYAEDNAKVYFVDVASKTLDEKGAVKADLFVKDGTKLNDKGFDLMHKLVEPAINDLLPEERFEWDPEQVKETFGEGWEDQMSSFGLPG